ncbi:MAG: NAD(P)/FAD-dependent oxidoreductase, partial [Phenylobacterium sp.]
MSRTRLRVVLAGAGHAHLLVLRRAGDLRAAGVEPVLVAPPAFHYSGLATAVLSGALPPRRARLDVAAFAAGCGVQHIPGEVAGVDRPARRLRLSDGRELAYDAVSFNVGSITQGPGDRELDEGTWTVKPLDRFTALRVQLEDSIRRRGASPALVVAGGGPTGFEVAAALAGLCERNGVRPDIRLIRRSPPDWAPPAALARLTSALEHRGVVMIDGEAAGRSDGTCRLVDGRTLPCDLQVLATGLGGPPVISGLGLPQSEEGRLRVGATLQSLGDPAIFAAGDCALVEAAPRPAAGVFGVRAAPVLARNLAALGAGAPTGRYAPQARWLSILDLGDETGLALRGGLWSLGRGALALKRRLDLGFMDRLRAISGEVLQ